MSLLKPFAGPAVLFFLGLFLGLLPWEVGLAMGMVWGAACFWTVFAVLSHKAMLDRFPDLPQWMPFLDVNGGFASEQQLTGVYVRQQNVRIALLAQGNRIRNRTFEGCVIHGPAVLRAHESTTTSNCKFESTRERCVWDGEGDDPRIGAIDLEDCTFRDCTFVGVGFDESCQQGAGATPQVQAGERAESSDASEPVEPQNEAPSDESADDIDKITEGLSDISNAA